MMMGLSRVHAWTIRAVQPVWLHVLLAFSLVAALSACSNDASTESAECRMQALKAKLPSPQQQVEFVDACMEARGYETVTAYSDANCSMAYGMRVSRCYVRPSFLQSVRKRLW